MANNDKIYEDLLNFVKAEIGPIWWKKISLNRETRLLEDLRINGDDAVDFFLKFEKKFKLNLNDLDLSLYFDSEGFDLIGISKLIRWTNLEKKTQRFPLTIGDLEKLILDNNTTK